MTELRLYDNPRAPSPRRVRIFLAEKGIEVAKTIVDLSTGEHFSDEFRALNPDCTVPTLVLPDGRAVTDSYAICCYFEAIQPDPPLMGRDPAERALVEAWARRIEIEGYQAAAHVLRHTHPAFEGRSIPGVLEGFPQIPALADQARTRFDRLLTRVDQALTDRPFVACDAFTVADIMLLVALDFGRRRIEPTLTPRIQRWYDAVSSRPSASA